MEELQEHIDPVYEDFLHRRIEVPGKSWTAQYPRIPLLKGPRYAASVHHCIMLWLASYICYVNKTLFSGRLATYASLQ